MPESDRDPLARLARAFAGGKARLLPIVEEVVARAEAVDPGVTLGSTTLYATLATPRRQFAVLYPASTRRLVLGLRGEGRIPVGGRVQAHPPARQSDVFDVKVLLSSVDEVDDEIGELLCRAWEANR